MVFNLIVTHEPGLDNYRWARNQMRQIVGEGLRYVTSYQSVILYDVDSDPHEVAGEVRESLKGVGTPIIRVIPVDAVAEPFIEEVVDVLKDLAPRLPEGKAFRVTLEGHLYIKGEEGPVRRLHTAESVREIAKIFSNPVNLENPEYVVYVKVVRYFRRRRKAAVSILKPSELKRVAF